MSKRWPLLIILLTLLVIFWPLLRGESFFWGLPALQFVPWRDFAVESLRAGQLPLWNPYNGAGAPLIANYQSAIYYPLNWPSFVLPISSAMSLTAVLHLFIAAWGMWAFTGRLGLPALGCGVSALAFALSSYLVARLGTFPMIHTVAWLPWLLWAVLAVLDSGRFRRVAALAIITALLLLAGHAQSAWYSLLLAGLFTLFWLAQKHPPGSWRRLALLIVGLVIGAMIAAIQLLPTAELLMSSQRSGGVDFDFAMNFSYGLPRALNLLSPNIFGNPGDGSYLTEGAFFEDAVYIGLLPLIAAIAALLRWLMGLLRRGQASPAVLTTVPFWFLIALIAFIFALGQNTPIFPFLYRNVPTFDLFQAPVRWHLWTVFALSVLAGIGTQVWGRGNRLFFGTRLAVAAGIGAALLALFVAPAVIPTPDNPDTARAIQVLIAAVALTGLLGAGAGVLTLLQPDRDAPFYRWWSLGVLLFVAADLGWAAQGLNPSTDANFYDSLPAPFADSQRSYWLEDAEEAVTFDRFLPFDDYRVAALNAEAYRASQLPNLNLLDRWPLLNNFDPLRIGAFEDYIALIETSESPDALLQAAHAGRVYGNQGEIFALEAPAQRAWLVESACWHEDEAAVIEAISAADWNPLGQVHLMGAGDCPANGESSGTVSIVDDSNNAVTLSVETETGGWLVLADTFYPGWTATVDSESAVIERANLAFRAVQVPAGAQTVLFEYRPAWLLPGTLLTVAGLLIVLALLRFRDQHKDEQGGHNPDGAEA